MNYCVTGGAGFIGSYLAEHLLKLGHHVHAIDDLSTGRLDNITHIRPQRSFAFTIRDVRQGISDLAEWADGGVFHLASVVGVKRVIEDPEHTISVSTQGTASVIEACAKHRRPLLLASTSEVYGGSLRGQFVEDQDLRIGPPTTPRWCYAAGKLLEEHAVMAHHWSTGLPVVVVRLFNTVGPRQTGRYGMVLPRFVRQVMNGGPVTIYGDGRQRRCFCHVRDVVHAMSLLIDCQQALGQVVNIGSDEEVSIRSLAKMVMDCFGMPVPIKNIDPREAYGCDFREIPQRVPSLKKASELIGYQPIYPLKATIKAVMHYEEAMRV